MNITVRTGSINVQILRLHRVVAFGFSYFRLLKYLRLSMMNILL